MEGALGVGWTFPSVKFTFAPGHFDKSTVHLQARAEVRTGVSESGCKAELHLRPEDPLEARPLRAVYQASGQARRGEGKILIRRIRSPCGKKSHSLPTGVA